MAAKQKLMHLKISLFSRTFRDMNGVAVCAIKKSFEINSVVHVGNSFQEAEDRFSFSHNYRIKIFKFLN